MSSAFICPYPPIQEMREVDPFTEPMKQARTLCNSGVVPLKKPGEMTPRTVLNVFGPMGQGGRYILDPLKTGEVNVDYYTDADLKIG